MNPRTLQDNEKDLNFYEFTQFFDYVLTQQRKQGALSRKKRKSTETWAAKSQEERLRIKVISAETFTFFHAFRS